MFVYFLNRWLISRNFEKSGDGYIYRRRPDLPGFCVSEEDRRCALIEFKSHYWRFWLKTLGLFFVSVLTIALCSVFLRFDDGLVEIASYILLACLIIWIYLGQRQWLQLPEMRFSDHPRIDPLLPTESWLSRFERRARERTWFFLAVSTAFYGLIALLLIPNPMNGDVWPWLIFAAFAANLALSIYGMIHKARAKRS